MAQYALAALRAHQQLQRRVHDFSFGLKVGQLARLAHQTLVNFNVRSTHAESIHLFLTMWCIFRRVAFVHEQLHSNSLTSRDLASSRADTAASRVTVGKSS